MKELRNEKQRLAWIINFMNQDIDNLGAGDFLKISAEIEENIRSLLLLPLTKKVKGGSLVYAPRLPPVNTPEWRNMIKGKQERLRSFLERLLEAKESSSVITLLKHNVYHEVYVSNGGIKIKPIGRGGELEYEFAELIYECSPSERMEFRSLDYIRRCQARGCKNFFVQLHKIDKNYCSNKCAWRAYSESKRKGQGIERGKAPEPKVPLRKLILD